LQDPRGLNALRQLVFDADVFVALAAIRAIGLIQHEQSERILSDVLFEKKLAFEVKYLAVRLLAFQNSWSARMTLYRIQSRNELGPQLTNVARTTYNEMR
jgi:hypothetical protein